MSRCRSAAARPRTAGTVTRLTRPPPTPPARSRGARGCLRSGPSADRGPRRKPVSASAGSTLRRGAASRERGASPRERGPSPRARGPSPRERGPSAEARGLSPARRGLSAGERGPSPRARGPSPRERDPSPRERAAPAAERGAVARDLSATGPVARPRTWSGDDVRGRRRGPSEADVRARRGPSSAAPRDVTGRTGAFAGVAERRGPSPAPPARPLPVSWPAPRGAGLPRPRLVGSPDGRGLLPEVLVLFWAPGAVLEVFGARPPGRPPLALPPCGVPCPSAT